MTPEPFENLDTSDYAPEHKRVVEISRNQFRRHGRSDAPIVWRGPALCAAVTYGHKGWLPVTLALTGDGMCYSNTSSSGGLLWCVSVRPPNTCRVKNGAFWVSKIDGDEKDARFGRIHPFMAYFSDPRDAAVPYLGAVAILKGRKKTQAFKEVLRSVGAEIA